ncbi:type II toxin-antitoxin system VapC family toxin [Methylophilus sp. 14]|uniref:type II toxin-antitoxin system tRNA(fMet)-specific endonuclease VapC n=1 Tax=Methylophilus sp. 14 TaxID=2781019 RepID=UPI001E28715C|nr:type II toxin-antitoxin system VapC family toxin [Methylophilus sp. 14]
MLDTNICIALIKQKPAGVLKRFNDFQVGDICISSVTLAELRYGVAKSQFQEKNQAALDDFILPLEITVFDESAANYYGALRASLERKGTPIGAMDLMIGAHALSQNLTMVTNNVREFNRIPNLVVVDWFND